MDYFELAKALARREGEGVMSKANEPAYPTLLTSKWAGASEVFAVNYAEGFTRREAYALAAMQALLTSWEETDNDKFPGQTIPERIAMIAHHAFQMADGMLAESEKPHE